MLIWERFSSNLDRKTFWYALAVTIASLTEGLIRSGALVVAEVEVFEVKILGLSTLLR